MTAYIPHKDMLLALSKMQRSIIRACNKETLPESFLIPQYPHFAFDKEKESTENKNPCSCRVLFPETDGMQVYFPFVLEYADGTQRKMKIIIATLSKIVSRETLYDKIKNAPEIDADAFPLKLRIFRKAQALVECNSWQIFNDKWFKLQ